ncbi:unnamed protein product [Rhizopus microsporus]
MNAPLADTMLAWSQNELDIYSTLSLIPVLSDLNWIDDKVIVCFAHRYFSESVPDLIQQLNQPNRVKLVELFKERADVDLETDTTTWLHQLFKWTRTQQDVYREQEGYMEFEKKANQLLSQLLQLYHPLVDFLNKEEQSVTSSRTITTERKGSFSSLLEEQSIINKHPSSFEDFEFAYQTIKSQDLVNFHACIPHYLRSHPNLSAINATQAALEYQLHKRELLRHTSQFQTTAAYIRNELEFIQAKMLKTTTTDTGIQDLEERVQKAGALLDSLPKLEDQQEQCEALVSKYKLICAWVEEVRVWFVEAERIRKWIEERIVLLEGRPPVEALDEVELDYTLQQVEQLNQEHEILEKQVETFDKQDMARLRAHVKALTGTDKDLSPADTTTIEITFTTLMILDRLMHLLRRRSYELQMLTLRVYWEQEYNVAVGWVRSMTEQVKTFMGKEARWRPTLSHMNESKNEVIEKLIDFEKQCTAFDQGQFTTTVNMYQDLDDSCHMELPSHLESRQVALEEAFEALTNRVAFARQVVEQYLMVTDFLDHADELKVEGEQLRQEITHAEQQLLSSPDLSEKVNQFQEKAVRLVTGLATRIPYPETTHPSDQQDNEDANETIRMVVGARKSALILLGEALDQALSSHRRALQLQKRAKQLQDEINRLTGWVDERLRALAKAKVDVFVGKCALDEVDLARLRKERDGQVSKLKGIRENDVKKLHESIHALHASPHHQSYMDTLNESLKKLEQQLGKLDEALSAHSLGLDTLAKRISWESQYSKASQWISNMTANIWDFTAKKAQWRPKDNPMSDWNQVEQEFKDIQAKVDAFESRQFDQLQHGFHVLIEGFSRIKQDDTPVADDNNLTAEHVKRRQDALTANFAHLKELCLYTQGILDQHIALEKFSARASELYGQGEKLMINLQQRLDDPLYSQEDDVELEEAVNEYGHQALDIWTSLGSQIPYPQCNEEARATRPSTADDEISTDIANVVFKTYTDLQGMADQLKELLSRLRAAVQYRKELEDCVQKATMLTKTMAQIKQQHMNMYTFEDQLYATTLQISSTKLDANVLSEKVSALNDKEYQPLIERIQILQDLEAPIDKHRLMAPTSLLQSAYKQLQEFTILFTHQVQCYDTRLHWESLLTNHMHKLETLQESVRDTINEKNFWLSREDNTNHKDNLLEKLVEELTQHDKILKEYVDQDLPSLEAAYHSMTLAFDTLDSSKSVPVFDKQSDIKKLVHKLQDLLTQQVSEINLLHTRHCWESHADKELKACSEFEVEIESFIKDYARWKSEQVDEKESSKRLDELQSTFALHVKTIQHLLDEFTELKLLTEATNKRKSSLESSKDHMQGLQGFMHEVLRQTEMIRACLARIQELENRAESLKARFLAADGIREGFETAFETYRSDVHQLNRTIPHPLPRSDKDDVAYNTSVSDMIQARYVRLEELASLLQSILESKEKLSRRRAAEASYLAEATTVKEWIQSKWMAIDQVAENVDEDLQGSVGAVSAIQSTVLAYSSSILALQASLVKYMALMEEDDDTLQTMQADMDAQYRKLCEHVQTVKDDLSEQLRRAEWTRLVSAFNTACAELTQEMTTLQVENITESVTLDWQERVKALEMKQLEPIKARTLNDDDMNQVLKTLNDLKEFMQCRIHEANNYRWKQKYLADAHDLESWLKETKEAVTEFRENQGSVQEKADPIKEIKEVYNKICESIEDRKDKYEELRSFHKFLQLNGLTEMDERQQSLEDEWKQLQGDVVQANQLIEQVGQWIALFDKLDAAKGTLKATVKALEAFDENTVLEELPELFEHEEKQLSDLLSNLDTLLSVAQSLHCQAPVEARQTRSNMNAFEEQQSKLCQEVDEAQRLLADKLKLAQRQVSLNICQTMISAVSQNVHKQIELWEKDLEAIRQVIDTTNKLEQMYIDKRGSTLETKRAEYGNQEVQIIRPALLQLKNDHSVDIKPMEDELAAAFDKLDMAIKAETGVQEMIRKLLGQIKSSKDIFTWITQCHQAIEQTDPHDENAEESMKALDEKMADFKPVMTSFKKMVESINDMPLPEIRVQGVWTDLVAAANENAKAVKEKWNTLEQARNEMADDIQRTVRSITMLRKIKHVIMLLADTREYLDNIKVPQLDEDTVSNSDIKIVVESEERNGADKLSHMLRQAEVEGYLKGLSTIEKDTKDQIEQEMIELEKMTSQCQEGDSFKHQYQETKDAIARLTDSIEEKKAELHKALELGQLLTTTDDLEILLSSLEEAIGKAVPHHVTLMGHGLGRADLQAKLIELDARFKYYESNIVKSFKMAKEHPISTQETKDVVENYLNDLEKRWNLLKKQYKTRKIELSRTIDSKELYQQQQQARIRKSSLPTRKASSLLRAADRVSPTPSTSSSSSSGSLRLSVIGRHQPSKSATHVKPRPSTRHAKPPLNSYVADPENDLDMEIGRIVNNAPYRVKVKMVPGEVGRYWFGDVNPKMAYCRVLKSKMVMVRVGGGWTELSQFLRDHALLEGDFIPKSSTPEVILEEEPSIQEGFIETRRAKPVPRSMSPSQRPTGTPSHSTNTSGGYKDGDKFITVDQHGNQLEVKMRRFSNDVMEKSSNGYTRRRIARKKEKLNNQAAVNASTEVAVDNHNKNDNSSNNNSTTNSNNTNHNAL